MKRKLIMIVASLMLSGMMFAQDLHWPAPNSSAFTYRNRITSEVKIDGVLQQSGDIEVAAFVGDEVRGVVRLIEPYPNALPDHYYTYLTIFANSLGETFTLKAYDHSSGTTYDNCLQEFVMTEDEHDFGGINIGYYLEFVTEPEPTYGPEHPWVPSSNYSGNGMGLTAQIQINGVPVDRASYEVGAFCGEECRGDVTPLTDFSSYNLGYFAFMNILGNDGDPIDFYLYDTESSTIFPGKCFTTLELANDTYVGQDVINDRFVLNFVELQTFTKPILAYSTEQNVNNHYYLIASPIGEVDPEEVTNMLSNSYDLYYFDQMQHLEWINYEGDNGNYNLMPGQGYLYANSQNVDLTFTGYPYFGDGEVTLTKDNGADLPGWNLVGNPFSVNATIGNRQFYVMNGDGTDLAVANRNYIEPMEGIFVEAENDGETLTFSTEPQSKGAALEMNVIRDRGTVIDRAIVNFGQQSTLTKFMINRDNTHISLPQDNTEYAAISAESEMGEIPVSFKAAANGNYSLCFSAEEVSFSYLHLIDNLTGADTDLLANPSYSFNALTTDYANRFKLVFATGNATDDGFTFFSNGSWIINNEGRALLQVVDVTGRIMKSEQIDGCYSLNLQAAPGVYMFRLINGDNMRVQKVVVK